MRNLRTVAVAAATALTITLGGVSVATAQESVPGVADPATDVTLSSALSSGATDLSEVGDELNADEEITGEDLLGEETVNDAPAWATQWVDLTAIAGLGTVVGLIIAGINSLKYIGVLPY